MGPNCAWETIKVELLLCLSFATMDNPSYLCLPSTCARLTAWLTSSWGLHLAQSTGYGSSTTSSTTEQATSSADVNGSCISYKFRQFAGPTCYCSELVINSCFCRHFAVCSTSPALTDLCCPGIWICLCFTKQRHIFIASIVYIAPLWTFLAYYMFLLY